MRDELSGRLRLIDQIGEGGAGMVWCAWDRRLRSHVAAKLVPPRSRRDASPGLTHRRVVVPHAVLADGARLVLVMVT